MANDEQTRTVAVVTFFYQGEYLSSLVFDNTETGDAAIATLQEILDFQEAGLSFRCEIKPLYDAQSILREMDAWKEGFVRPQGTILKLMRIIGAMKSN
mgnify:FL=1